MMCTSSARRNASVGSWVMTRRAPGKSARCRASTLRSSHAGGHVESGEGLVEKQEIRIDDQRPGQGDPLRLTPGELRWLSPLETSEIETLQPASSSLHRLVTAHPRGSAIRKRHSRAPSYGETTGSPGTQLRSDGPPAGRRQPPTARRELCRPDRSDPNRSAEGRRSPPLRSIFRLRSGRARQQSSRPESKDSESS